VAGYALGRLDDLPGGWNRMSRAVLRSRENTDEYATALGLQGLGVLARAMRRQDLAEAFSVEAQGILIKLGVVGTPLFHADLEEPV
jgi:hypothetical protein